MACVKTASIKLTREFFALGHRSKLESNATGDPAFFGLAILGCVCHARGRTALCPEEHVADIAGDSLSTLMSQPLHSQVLSD